MPGPQILAFGQPPVGAGSGQPAQSGNLFRGQHQTRGHQSGPVAVVSASTGPGVQQVAGHPGVRHFASLAVLKFLQTAASAAVAQGLPLLAGHLFQGQCFPERRMDRCG